LAAAGAAPEDDDMPRARRGRGRQGTAAAARTNDAAAAFLEGRERKARDAVRGRRVDEEEVTRAVAARV